MEGDYTGLTKFTLARSLVLVKANKGQPPRVISIPAEAVGEGTDFGIRQLGASAAEALQVTKLGNSNLVSSLTLGRSLNRARPSLPIPASAAPPKPTLRLAVAIDVQALLSAAQPGASLMTGVTRGEGVELAYTVAFAPVGADAIATRALDLNRTGSLYFYSACRQATLRFLNAPLAGRAYTLMVADPHFVQTVAVAPGRTIVSHSACGVDVLAGSVAQGIDDPAIAQTADLARSLNAQWATRLMADSTAALAALKPQAPARPTRRKGKTAVAASEAVPATAPAQLLPPPPANGPLRNAEIRVPTPRPGQSFAF